MSKYCTSKLGLGNGDSKGNYGELGGTSSVARGREANVGKRVGFEKSGKGGMIGRYLGADQGLDEN